MLYRGIGGERILRRSPPFFGSEETEPNSDRPLLYRLAAFVLLLIFLFNAYQTVRAWLGR